MESFAPLDGVRVVELATFVAAPSAGALLADLGADVVKVEVPRGEIYRHSRPKLMGVPSDFPEAPQFQMDNRGKRSLALDITRPAALSALQRLVEGADVFLTNMLPHRLEKYGLDAATLREKTPRLIAASLSGYGHDGPDATSPAFDYTAYWARTGFMDLMRDPGDAPAFLRPGVGDHAAALSLVTGILAALRMRDRSGEGQRVDVNLMHVGYYILGNDAALALAGGRAAPHHQRTRPRNPLWNQYRTGDDRWLFLVMVESDRYWAPLCQAIERPDLLEYERFTDARARYKSSAELVAILDEVIGARSLEEWEKHLAGHTIIWAPVRTLEEALHDPQARATGVFREVNHPTAGTYETVAPPLEMSGFPMDGTRPAPALGADGETVLREAGLETKEIEDALG
jgi:crotonobetainyl-CoA:carnitine CoA-transferase CaiB-like acyl-CoA transferase